MEPSITPESLIVKALQGRAEGRLHDAHRDFASAADLARQYGAQALLGRALTGLGQIERDLNHLDVALKHYQDAAAIYSEIGDLMRFAHATRHIADLHMDAGHTQLAEARYIESLALYRDAAETKPLDLANTIRGLAILKQNMGDIGAAKLYWREAQTLYTTANVKEGIVETARRLALLETAE
ncbi:MAG: hypothetical protein ACKV2U_14880 [Bryobacteraceae bacterium]